VSNLLFSLEPPLVSIMTSTGSFEGACIRYSASLSIISKKGTQALHKYKGLNNQAVKEGIETLPLNSLFLSG
jgi:hypothetical protein